MHSLKAVNIKQFNWWNFTRLKQRKYWLCSPFSVVTGRTVEAAVDFTLFVLLTRGTASAVALWTPWSLCRVNATVICALEFGTFNHVSFESGKMLRKKREFCSSCESDGLDLVRIRDLMTRSTVLNHIWRKYNWHVVLVVLWVRFIATWIQILSFINFVVKTVKSI